MRFIEEQPIFPYLSSECIDGRHSIGLGSVTDQLCLEIDDLQESADFDDTEFNRAFAEDTELNRVLIKT